MFQIAFNVTAKLPDFLFFTLVRLRLDVSYANYTYDF